MKFLSTVCTAVLTAASLPLASAQDTPATVVDIAVGSDDFETLVTAVSTAGLVETLQGEGPFTVFAPTNDAFAALGEDTIEKLLSEPFRAHLTDVLLYHVLSGEVFSTDLSLGLAAETLNGESINVTSLDPPTINDAEVVTADVEAENGVVHVVDAVLLPSSVTNTAVDVALANPDFSTLVELLTAADLVETLSGPGPYTIFAPTNEAFGKLDPSVVETVTDPDNVDMLTNILTYHVTSGVILSESLSDGASVTMVNGDDAVVGLDPPSIAGAEIVTTDILVSNGVIHVIDSVMLPPSDKEEEEPEEEMEDEEPKEETEGEGEEEEEEADPTITDLAVATEDLSTLVDLVVLADLAETLSGPGPFTAFAPVNDAFAALDEDTVSALTADPSGALTDVLLYHVVPGIIMSTDLIDGAMVATVGGAEISVSLDPVMINDANVVTADIMASNGVVHIIDKVLIPPSEEEEEVEEEEEDMEEGTATLSYVGNDGDFDTFPLALCMGDCDKDEDCEEGLICFQRDSEDPVPGCDGPVDVSKTDYCITPQDDEDRDPPLHYVGNNGDFDVFPLTLCMGDCDSNSDCDGDLVCFQRDSDDPVPGCAGSDHSLSDYCVEPTIVDVAIATEDLSTLVDLVVMADLAGTLSGEGPFTVFAPVNEAFAALDDETVEFLTSDEGKETLVDILTYHVLPGIVTSDMLEEGAEVTMVNGDVATVSLESGPSIAGVDIIATDITTRNGVVHLLDGVMMPPN